MPNKEWDEDPWDHSTHTATWPVPSTLPLKKAPATGYQMSTVSAAVIQAIRTAVHDEVSRSVGDTYQRIMDRLDELEEAINRGR